ncbi:unnamed protein product, partial [marine sediment metagenome]
INGDWVVGKASYLYRFEITQDHYANKELSIASSLEAAVALAVKKIETPMPESKEGD